MQNSLEKVLVGFLLVGIVAWSPINDLVDPCQDGACAPSVKAFSDETKMMAQDGPSLVMPESAHELELFKDDEPLQSPVPEQYVPDS